MSGDGDAIQFLSERSLMQELRSKYPFDRAGYFYDGECSSLRSVSLSSRVGVTRMIRVTSRFALQVGAQELIGFTDRLAGWRGVPRAKRFAKARLPLDDLGRFVERHVFFRDPEDFSDNYYLTDAGLDWFAVFCHEGDWHVYARARSALRALSLR